MGNTTASPLLNKVMSDFLLHNDAALARFLSMPAPVISSLRSGRLKFGPSYIIRLHELTCWPVGDIKELLQQHEKDTK